MELEKNDKERSLNSGKDFVRGQAIARSSLLALLHGGPVLQSGVTQN